MIKRRRIPYVPVGMQLPYYFMKRRMTGYPAKRNDLGSEKCYRENAPCHTTFVQQYQEQTDMRRRNPRIFFNSADKIIQYRPLFVQLSMKLIAPYAVFSFRRG